MSTVQPTDRVLVNRAGIDYSAPADMSTVQDADLLLINRAGVDYKCTFADWKASQSKAPDVGTVTLADDAPGGNRFTSQTFTSTVTMTDDGTPASTKGIKAWVEGTLTVTTTPATDVITAVGGTTTSPVLTFASSKDLAKFAVGDDIRQNAGGIPTGVGFTVYTSRTLYDNIPDIKAHATLQTDLRPHVEAGVYAYFLPTFTVYPPGQPAIFLGSAPGLGLGGFSVRTTHDTWVYIGGNIDFTDPSSFERVTISSTLPSSTFVYGVDVKFMLVHIRGGDKNTPPNAPYTLVSVNDGTPHGVVGSINAGANQMTLSISAGSWGPPGSGYYGIGKPKTSTIANAKLYAKLNATLNVTDLQSADPGYTAFTGLTPRLTFPALLPSGNAPDKDLPAGTTLQTEVYATNANGSDTAQSAKLTPA